MLGVFGQHLQTRHHEQGAAQQRFKFVACRIINRVQDVDGFFGERRVAFHVGGGVRRGGFQACVVRQNGVLALLGHEERQVLPCCGAHGFGKCAFNAALLQPNVDDARHVVGQGEVGVGLDEEQNDSGND